MIKDIDQLRVTMEQMKRLFRTLDDLKATVLPRNPELFAAMAEGPLHDLDRLREDISGFVHELKTST